MEVGAPPPHSERQQPLHCSEGPLGAKTPGGGLGSGMEESRAFSPVTLTEGRSGQLLKEGKLTASSHTQKAMPGGLRRRKSS